MLASWIGATAFRHSNRQGEAFMISLNDHLSSHLSLLSDPPVITCRRLRSELSCYPLHPRRMLDCPVFILSLSLSHICQKREAQGRASFCI